MSYKLNSKIEGLTPYCPISGEYKIRLDANESTYKLDENIEKKIAKKISSIEFNRYPDPYAVKLCKSFAKNYGIDPKFVTAGNGSDELIGLIVGSFLYSGDKMLTFTHDFSMYRFYGELYGMNNIVYEKNEDLTIDVDGVIKFINQTKISMLIFSNPCNPTSLGLKKEDVIKLISSVNCLVILDEAYMDFYNQSLIKLVEDFDNLIILRTASKAIGLAGVRLGFAVANVRLTTALKAAKSPYNVNTISQAVGEVVFGETDYINKLNDKLIQNKNELLQSINAFKSQYNWCDKIYDSKTNFAYIKTENAQLIFNELKNHGIAIRNMGEYLRISTGTKQENAVLLDELKSILNGMLPQI